MALASTGMEDFSGGMYRGRRSPANAVYDALNVLVSDEGTLVRRGGGAYKSNADAGSTLLGLFDGYLSAGQRTMAWSSSGIWFLSADDATLTTFSSPGGVPNALAKPAVVSGVLYLSCSNVGQNLFLWGGARKASASLTSPTVTFTNGSAIATASGTSWASLYEAGTIVASGQTVTTVKSVDSNTQITLATPWTGATGATSATIYNWFLGGNTPYMLPLAVGSPPRLLSTDGKRVFFSARGEPNNIDIATDFHEMSTASVMLGRESLQGIAFWFASDGIWGIENLAMDDVDAYGNIQHQVTRISKDVVLWGDPGIAAWGGSLVVPAVDDVYLFAPGSPLAPITGGRGNPYDGGIRNLYQGYVKAGYQPGQAAVHRSTYLLPILNGTTLVDTLVCRLDHGFAWTRWDGHSAGIAYVQRVGSTSRSPKLLGLAGQRITDLTGCFDPEASNALDADGSSFTSEIITRDFSTGQQPGFVQRARLRYELEDGGTPDPAVAIAYSSDQDGGVFTDLTERGEQNGGAGWGVSDGSKYSWALVAKRRERIRFRVRVTGACSRFVLRSIELLTRPQGRQ